MAIADAVEIERNQAFYAWADQRRRMIDPAPNWAELAEEGGFQQSVISRIKNNETTVTALIVVRVSNALSVSPYEGFVAAKFIEDEEHRYGATLRQVDRILEGLDEDEREEIVRVVEILAFTRKKKKAESAAMDSPPRARKA
jgi:transcriptional regulator with XRE-family HTH domain